jgi:hypothetical protein
MKAILFALTVLIITAVIQPSINLSYAQDNCTCAECGYVCKTPMVHASDCKYRNKRQSEEKSEVNSETKSAKVNEEAETTDTEYQMLMIQSRINSVSYDATIDNEQKEKQMLEQKELLNKLTPENESQKLMYDDISAELKNILLGIQNALEKR